MVGQLCNGGSSELPILALSDGADGYFTKPCDLEELVLRADRLLCRQAVTGPAAGPIEMGEVLMQAAWLDDQLEKRPLHLPATGAPFVDTGSETPPAEGIDFDISTLPVPCSSLTC